MKKHLIKEYYMYELVDNGVVDTIWSPTPPNINPTSQDMVFEVLKGQSYEFYHTPFGRIFWNYGEGDGIFWGTDQEYAELDSWIQAEMQSLIQDDM